MNYKLEWTSFVKDSYFEEIEFSYLKWNVNEVVKFEKLVEKELSRFSVNPKIGNLDYSNIYSLSLSKKTKLFYRINYEFCSIELLLFWNNQKNPDDLMKLF